MVGRSTNINWQCAEFGMQFCQTRFPMGGINRKDIYDLKSTEIHPQLLILDKLRKEYNSPTPDSKVINDCVSQLNGGFCGELAAITRLAIAAKFPAVPVELISFDAHQAILIGRKRGNPRDINTWVDDDCEGVILDPWSNEFYYISALHSKKKGPSIPFYRFKNLFDYVLETNHHLSGNPTVLPSTNYYKDEDDIATKTLINKKLSENAKHLYAKSVGLFKATKYSEAVIYLNKALLIFEQIDKESLATGTCYSTLASCYRELLQIDEAFECCTKAITLIKNIYGEESIEVKKLYEKYTSIKDTQHMKLTISPAELKQTQCNT